MIRGVGKVAPSLKKGVSAVSKQVDRLTAAAHGSPSVAAKGQIRNSLSEPHSFGQTFSGGTNLARRQMSSQTGSWAGYEGGRSAWVQTHTSGYQADLGRQTIGTTTPVTNFHDKPSMPRIRMTDYTSGHYDRVLLDRKLSQLL